MNNEQRNIPFSNRKKAEDTTLLNGRMDTVESELAQKVKKDELVVNVRDHGAVGDGIADDTEALRTVFEAYPNGAVFYFPKGTYLVGENPDSIPIFSSYSVDHRGAIPSRSKIIGDGKNLSVIKISKNFKAGNGNSRAIWLSSFNNVVFEDIGFDGGFEGASDPTDRRVNLIWFQSDAKNIEFNRCLFRGSSSNTVNIGQNSSNLYFNKCLFEDNAESDIQFVSGGYLNDPRPIQNIYIDKCKFKTGIDHPDTNAEDGLCIHWESYSADPSAEVEAYKFTKNVHISDCDFEANGERVKYYISQNANDAPVHGLFVDGCLFDGLYNGLPTARSALRLSPIRTVSSEGTTIFTSSVKVSDCSFRNFIECGSSVIATESTYKKADKNLVTFDNCSFDTVSKDDNAGGYLGAIYDTRAIIDGMYIQNCKLKSSEIYTGYGGKEKLYHMNNGSLTVKHLITQGNDCYRRGLIHYTTTPISVKYFKEKGNSADGNYKGFVNLTSTSLSMNGEDGFTTYVYKGTATGTITLYTYTSLGKEFTFINGTTNQLRIDTDKPIFPLKPGTTTDLVTSEKGARITITPLDSGSWIIKEISGTWAEA